MMMVDHAGQAEEAEGIQFCPFCQKMFMYEKSLLRHVMQAHRNREYMSYSFQADLYSRWQERLPRLDQ